MPRSSTGPEVLIRSELHRRGLRFRVNDSRLPGRPDVALTGAMVAVFVDGCFWHACPDHGTLPKNNRDWWRAKLERNVERDREKDAQLESMGWVVVHVWEHENPIEAAAAIEKLWRSRRRKTTRRVTSQSLSAPCEILDDIVDGTGSLTQCSHEDQRPSRRPQRG